MSVLLILIVIIQVAMIIAFFKMASGVAKIRELLEALVKIAINNPTNWIQLKCDKCGHEFKASLIKAGENVSCPKCKALNKVIS